MRISLRERAGRFAKLAELLFFPSSCRLCTQFLEQPGERVVCWGCLERLDRGTGPACLCCGRFFEGTAEPHFCASCLAGSPPYTLHRSCGRYEGGLKDLVRIYKYEKTSVLGKVLAAHMERASAAAEELWGGLDLVIPVPLHPRRKRERGFNQAEMLARNLAASKGVRILDGCLVKIRNVPPQTSLEADERERNVKGVYRVKKKERLEGKTVLLVDDVFTTGATIAECARTLIEAGAAEVRALTLAQA